MRMGGPVTMRIWGVALALAGVAAAPLSAQQTTAQQAPANIAVPAPAPSPDTVGPEQLRDFSLPGTVTRRTETSPATTTTAVPGQPAASDAPPLAVRSRPVESTAPSRSVTVALPPVDPLSREPTLAPPVAEATPALGSPPDAIEPGASPTASLPATDESGSWMPWVFALLLLAGGAGLYLWRHRSVAKPAYAGGARVEDLVATPAAVPPVAPRMAQPAPSPVRAPAPAPTRPDGIVSTRLRPWIDIEFGATRAVVTDDTATVHFDIVLYNSGSAPARDVLVEGQLFNAGPDQDRELGIFFERPAVKIEPIAEIAPLARVEMKSAVALSRAEVKEYEVEGRKLFVPILGFNAHYRYGTNHGQTSASFIVGRGGDDGGKMAPIRLDLGPRVFRGLGARQHIVGVRA